MGVNYEMRETMLNFARVSAVTILISSPLAAEDAPYDSAKPLPHATLFAPDVISTGDYESHATLMPDGREIYFLKMAPNFSRWSIFVSRYRNGRWSQPEVAPFSGQYQAPILTLPLTDDIFTSFPIARLSRATNASRIMISGSWTRSNRARHWTSPSDWRDGARRVICQPRSIAMQTSIIQWL